MIVMYIKPFIKIMKNGIWVRGSGHRAGSLLTYRENEYSFEKKYSMHSCGVNKALNLIYEIYGPYIVFWRYRPYS